MSQKNHHFLIYNLNQNELFFFIVCKIEHFTDTGKDAWLVIQSVFFTMEGREVVFYVMQKCTDLGRLIETLTVVKEY